jgi:hypothetical protein
MSTYQLNAIRCDYCGHEEVSTFNIRDMRKALKEHFGWSLEKVDGELKDVCNVCLERPDYREMIEENWKGQKGEKENA